MPLTPLDFPASPTLNQTYPNPPVTGQPTYKWDGSVWLAFDEETPGPESPDRYVKKNYIINGAMQVNQENPGTPTTTTASYPLDMFSMAFANAGTQTALQITSVSPGGSPNRLRITATVADASVAAGDFLRITQGIEGLRTVDFRQGTASAKTITIQFGVKAPAGTYCVALLNAAGNRSYVAEYTIAGGEANTDVVKSVTITLDQTGTWAVDNTVGMYVIWTLMAGTTYQTTANAWTTGFLVGTSNQHNFMSTSTPPNNVFELFDVSLTEGAVAPPFQVPDYASELALCQRYYQFWSGALYAGYNAAGGSWIGGYPISPIMRAAPTVAQTGIVYGNASALTLNVISANFYRPTIVITASGYGYATANTAFNARL